MTHRSLSLLLLAVLLFVCATGTWAQDKEEWSYNAVNSYRITPNIVYSTANGYDCKLDLYARAGSATPLPVVLYIHGGGWVGGTKETALMNLLPYFELGIHVINVEYRLARVSLAPAAVQDCRLALRWVFKNAKQYGFDTTKVIVTGGSAGGHLALTTGMLDASYGFDYPTDWDYAGVEPKVAAIINWFGITDVKELLAGPNKQDYAVDWLANLPNKEAVASSVSPINMVRKGLPPIFTVHGDKDQLVPYTQAVRLHEALTKAGVPNQMITIPGGKHGGFNKAEMKMIYAAIVDFLKKNKVLD
ncbi:MAG TPA: alpha/beta hydrolase [Bacteroidota bacterium]|nr:alpha/beta hydrolase [Bacteroidota bacterium]